MARRRLGIPGLAVKELRGTSLGTNDLQEGRAAVFVKSAGPDEHPVVLHEFLATRLAHSMGIPVPFGEIAQVPEHRRGWASAILGSSGQPAPPADLSLAVEKEAHIFAGICVFDVWIHNVDRSEENTYFSDEFGLWAIDHEKAFGEYNPYVPNASMQKMFATVWTSRQFKELVSKHDVDLTFWENLVSQFGEQWARNAADAAKRRGLAYNQELQGYEDFLTVRAKTIGQLLDKAFHRPTKLFSGMSGADE